MVKSLQMGKYRQMYGKFVVEGEKLIHELLLSSFTPSQMYALSSWDKPENCPPVTLVSPAELQRISGQKTPNQVLAVVPIPQQPIAITASEPVLLLDDIQDPGNMGTLIRTADWFGIKHVVCSPHSVDFFHPKVVQSSMGAVFRVHPLVCDLPQWMASSGKNILAAVLDGVSIQDKALHITETDSLVIGSESHGISDEVLSLCSKKITIPRLGHGDSLNAAVSAGILMSRIYLKK